MAYPYDFVKKLGNVGVGVENLGFLPPSTLPLYDGWMRARYRVRGQLDPQAPGFVKSSQQFQPVSLLGNGSYLQGQLALQALAQLTGGN